MCVNLAHKQKQHLFTEFTCDTGPYECVSAHEAEQRLAVSVPHWDQHLTHQLNPIQLLLNGVGLAVTLETAGRGNCLVSSEGSPKPSGLDWPGSRCGSGFRPQTPSVSQLVSQSVPTSAFSFLPSPPTLRGWMSWVHLSLLSVCQVSLSRLRNIPEAKLGDAAGPSFLLAMCKWPADDEKVKYFKMVYSVGLSESLAAGVHFTVDFFKSINSKVLWVVGVQCHKWGLPNKKELIHITLW